MVLHPAYAGMSALGFLFLSLVCVLIYWPWFTAASYHHQICKMFDHHTAHLRLNFYHSQPLTLRNPLHCYGCLPEASIKEKYYSNLVIFWEYRLLCRLILIITCAQMRTTKHFLIIIAVTVLSTLIKCMYVYCVNCHIVLYIIFNSPLQFERFQSTLFFSY